MKKFTYDVGFTVDRLFRDCDYTNDPDKFYRDAYEIIKEFVDMEYVDKFKKYNYYRQYETSEKSIFLSTVTEADYFEITHEFLSLISGGKTNHKWGVFACISRIYLCDEIASNTDDTAWWDYLISRRVIEEYLTNDIFLVNFSLNEIPKVYKFRYKKYMVELSRRMVEIRMNSHNEIKLRDFMFKKYPEILKDKIICSMPFSHDLAVYISLRYEKQIENLFKLSNFVDSDKRAIYIYVGLYLGLDIRDICVNGVVNPEIILYLKMLGLD